MSLCCCVVCVCVVCVDVCVCVLLRCVCVVCWSSKGGAEEERGGEEV